MRIGFNRRARYTLTLTGDNTAEISEATPDRTSRRMMLRGTRPMGAWRETPRVGTPRHGLDQEDVSRTDRAKIREGSERDSR